MTRSPEDFAKLSVDLDAAERVGEHSQRFNLTPTQHAPVIRTVRAAMKGTTESEWVIMAEFRAGVDPAGLEHAFAPIDISERNAPPPNR